MGKFPIKKQGDDLGAEHVNWLTAGVERIMSLPGGGGDSPALSPRNPASKNSVPLPPFSLQRFEVVEEECDGNPDLYRIVARYWDNTTREWATEDSEGDKGFSLDATDTGQSYGVGDRIQAYYDAQRGAYIPLAAAGGNEIIKFRILSTSPAIGRGFIGCDFVRAEVTLVGCRLSGVQIGDEVHVWDSDPCKFVIPANLLIGLRGTAQRFQNPFTEYDGGGLVDCEYAVLAEGACHWVVTDLCCAEEYTI